MKRYRLFLATIALLGPANARADTTPAVTPAPVAYVVKRGETLFQLWRGYFAGPTAVQQIARLNHITNMRQISTGKVLYIPRALLRDELSIGKVETFSGPVTLHIGTQTSAAKVGDTFAEGAEIETGRNAFVALRLADGSVLALPSQSSLRITRLRKVKLNGALEREITLGAGRVRTKVTPMTNPDSNFRVVTPIAVSAVRGTEFRVDYESTGAFSATQVDEGKVKFADHTDTGGLELPPGFGAANAAGHPTGVIKLLAPPKLDQPDKVQSEAELHFAIKPFAEATRYHLQIAKDAGFLEEITEVSGAEPNFTLPSLPGDSYFVRVSAYDRFGLEGSPETYTFERRRNLVKGAVDASPPGVRRLRFRWDGAVDGTPQYRFQLAKTGAADAPLVDEAGLSANVLSVSNLPPGDYSWRVCSMLIVKGKVVATWTPAQSIHVGK